MAENKKLGDVDLDEERVSSIADHIVSTYPGFALGGPFVLGAPGIIGDIALYGILTSTLVIAAASRFSEGWNHRTTLKSLFAGGAIAVGVLMIPEEAPQVDRAVPNDKTIINEGTGLALATIFDRPDGQRVELKLPKGSSPKLAL